MKLSIAGGEDSLRIEVREALIFALAKLIESRSPDTSFHLERVREYSRTLAQYVVESPDFAGKLPDDFVESIYLTSSLHDIGNVCIPDFIIQCPARLTPEQARVMRQHTTLGAEALSVIAAEFPDEGFIRMACDIALYHHERYDGKGYPTGISGANIPLCARIVSLADAYDAMTTPRAYRQPVPHTLARMLIDGGRGKQFDPLVVDAFLASEGEFVAIMEQFGGDTLLMAA